MSDLNSAVRSLIEEVLEEHGLIEAEGGKKGKKGSKEKEDKPAKKGGKKVTLDTVKDKLTDFVNEKGKKEAVKLLKEFGAKNAAEIEEDDYAKFIAAVDKVLAGDDDEDEDEDDEDEEEFDGKKGKGKKKSKKSTDEDEDDEDEDD